jgi:hypothetical protein
MSIYQQVERYVAHQRFGKVFTNEQVLGKVGDDDNKKAINMALKRIAEKGAIVRLSVGVYYRPKLSQFGALPVDAQELVATVSRTRNADFVVAGVAAANALGLSTQLPMVRSFIVSTRIRANYKTANIKLQYSARFKHFADELKLTDTQERQNAFLLYSALAFFDQQNIAAYEAKLQSCFSDLLSQSARECFFKAMPKTMYWVHRLL